MNTNNPSVSNVERESARKKLIFGIVFTAIPVFSFILEIIGVITGLALISVILFILTFPCLCVGIPFLIIGLIGLSKANSTNSGSQNFNTGYAQPQYQPQEQYQAQPQYQPQEQYQAQPQYQSQEQYQYQSQEQFSHETENTYSNANGFVDLDWRKYAPLDAGVSLKPGKDYKFHRAEGWAGSVPQSFVNRTFPKCPICCSNEPYWTIAQHNQMSWKGNLYLFKCSCCDSIISMSMPDVTTLGNGGAGFAANASVGLTNLLVKSNSGKEVGAVYAVIESTGRSGVDPQCQGKEFKLEHLQDMFLRM